MFLQLECFLLIPDKMILLFHLSPEQPYVDFLIFFLKNNVVTDNTIPAAKNKIVNLQSNETSTIKAPKNWKTQNKIVGIN